MLKVLIAITLILAIEVSTISAGCLSKSTCDVRINNNCYSHFDKPQSWNEAEACCVAWGGHLASIHSKAVNYHLNEIRNKERYTWIGLKHNVGSGVYKWTDWSDYDYNSIAGAYRYSVNEPCFHFNTLHRGELTWNDFNCSRSNWRSINTSYICQKKECPCMQQWGCDLVQNRKCYVFGDYKSTWHEAERCCVEWGGHLASIHSDQENRAVNSIRNENHWTWIGLNDIAEEGKFVWTDGTPYDYNNFRSGEPNNAGTENCINLVHKESGELKWNDSKCEKDSHLLVKRISYVCKKDYDLNTKR